MSEVLIVALACGCHWYQINVGCPIRWLYMQLLSESTHFLFDSSWRVKLPMTLLWAESTALDSALKVESSCTWVNVFDCSSCDPSTRVIMTLLSESTRVDYGKRVMATPLILSVYLNCKAHARGVN